MTREKLTTGFTFERIGGREGCEFNRLEALDRLGRSDNTHVVWSPVDQLYKVTWKKTSSLPQKRVTVCSKSGRIIRTNCANLTDASLDVRLKCLLELQFGDPSTAT